MSFLLDSGLKFLVADLQVSLDDNVGEILVGHENKDEKAIQKALEDYDKNCRLFNMGLQMIIDGNLKEWDWKWLAERGNLCERDWEWFGERLREAGVSKEEFDKKWKLTYSHS